MNTARFPDHHPETNPPAQPDRGTGSVAGPDPPSEYAEQIVEVRDGLTIVAPSDPPRPGQLAARALLKILLDAAVHGGEQATRRPPCRLSSPSQESS